MSPKTQARPTAPLSPPRLGFTRRIQQHGNRTFTREQGEKERPTVPSLLSREICPKRPPEESLLCLIGLQGTVCPILTRLGTGSRHVWLRQVQVHPLGLVGPSLCDAEDSVEAHRLPGRIGSAREGKVGSGQLLGRAFPGAPSLLGF